MAAIADFKKDATLISGNMTVGEREALLGTKSTADPPSFFLLPVLLRRSPDVSRGRLFVRRMTNDRTWMDA